MSQNRKDEESKYFEMYQNEKSVNSNKKKGVIFKFSIISRYHNFTPLGSA